MEQKKKPQKPIKEEINQYEPQRKNYMISMKLNYQQKNGLSILHIFWEKSTRSIQMHSLNNGIH